MGLRVEDVSSSIQNTPAPVLCFVDISVRPCRTRLIKELLQNMATLALGTLRSLFRRYQRMSLQDTAHKTSPSKYSNWHQEPFVRYFVDISVRPCRTRLVKQLFQNEAAGIRKEPFVLYIVESACVPAGHGS